MIAVNVVNNTSRLDRLQDSINASLIGGAPGPIREAFCVWAEIYRSDMQERYKTFSRGGGTWPPLARSTIVARARRPLTRLRHSFLQGDITEEQYKKRLPKAASAARRNKKRWLTEPGSPEASIVLGMVTILIDTGTLMATLSPKLGRPGQYENHIPYGIQVGFGGPGQHPKGKATIADIAVFHQFGRGHNPVREILVDPSADASAIMEHVFSDALRKQAEEI